MTVVVEGSGAPEREGGRLLFPEAEMSFKVREELSTMLFPRIVETEASFSGLENVRDFEVDVAAFVTIFLSSSREALEIIESLKDFPSSFIR